MGALSRFSLTDFLVYLFPGIVTGVGVYVLVLGTPLNRLFVTFKVDLWSSGAASFSWLLPTCSVYSYPACRGPSPNGYNSCLPSATLAARSFPRGAMNKLVWRSRPRTARLPSMAKVASICVAPWSVSTCQ